MKVIKSLQSENIDSLYKVFQRAFKDYEIQLTKDQLQVMLKRRGFVSELSFGTYVNDELVAFTFNGIGNFNGVKTAYDTGTGTIDEYRGKGLATKIFNYSIPFLKAAGVSQYLLEVLQHNTKAISVYQKIGFEVSREFNYFIKEKFQFEKNRSQEEFYIQSIKLDRKIIRPFLDFQPSWQNSFEAIERKQDDFIILGAFAEDQLLGYCIIELGSGDITQVAVAPEHRRRGIATALIQTAFKTDMHSSVKLINAEASCASITGFLNSIGLPLAGKQFEMTKQL